MPHAGRIRSLMRRAHADEPVPPVPRTAGVMTVRDALDIVPVVVAHHLTVGVERVHVIDDGSTDGTSELLAAMAEKSGRVTHHRVIGDDDPQLESVNEASNRLIAEGARLIVPFDADEFWDLTPDLLRRWVEDERPRRITASWVNYAQAREYTYPRPHGLLAVLHRAGVEPSATVEAVSAYSASFLNHGPVAKTMVWSQDPLSFFRGQHHVELAEGAGLLAEESAGIDVMHVPLRWRSELTKRALNYEPRRARQRVYALESWQTRLHLDAVHTGRDAAMWAAHSVDADGCLDVYGRRVQLARDDRLRDALVTASSLLEQWGIPTP